MKKTKSGLVCVATSLSTLAFATQTQPATTTSPLPQKPAWLTDLSVGVKESYDDNVFLSGVTAPPGDAIQPDSAAATKNVWSWVTTFSPKIGVDFAPLLAKDLGIDTLSVAYVPDFVLYHNATTENYDAHRLVNSIKGEAGSFTYGLDNTATYIDGDKYGPTYPGNFISAFGIAAPRERRKQIQDRGAVALQYNMGDWFIRSSASLILYDLMTVHINGAAPGYLNYVSRHDVNGGPDLGYKVTPHLAVTLGYRYGYQYQQELFNNPVRSTSDYQRLLFGLEGKPLSWLDVKIQIGPDFRNYISTAPLNDLHRVTYYGEAAITASVTSKDSVTFKYKGWQWVSCIGYVPYFESTYDLTYHRKLTGKLGLDLEGKLSTADYDMGNLIQRYDMQYSVAAGLTYALNSHASVNLSYNLDLGRSGDNTPNNVPEDQYNRQLVMLGAACKF